MGVRPPEEEVEPRTPPGPRGPGTEDSEDDLYSDTGPTTKTNTTALFSFDRDIDFRNILRLPDKGVFEDFLGGVDPWDPPNDKKYCGRCFEDVKRDLKKLAEVVDTFREERDAARKENEELKKEIEALKKSLKKREETDEGSVKVNIKNGEDNIDVLVRKSDTVDDYINSIKKSDKGKKFGILSMCVSVPKNKLKPPDKAANAARTLTAEAKPKKTIADLRREFFAKEFESQQETFTASNYLEIKPEEKKETFRSKLNIRVKPKKKISEIMEKLTCRASVPKEIPDHDPISMFQRFEKTRTVWVNELEEKSLA